MVQLFFTQQMWNTLDYNFGAHPMLYGLVFILMFVGNTTIFFLSLYCAYLLVKRRDIFPQTLFFLLIFQLTLVLFDEFFSRSIFKEEVTNLEGFSELIRGISFAVIWSLYLFNSTRVKGTFVIPSKTTLMEIATTPALSSLPAIPVSEMPNNEHTRPSHPNQE